MTINDIQTRASRAMLSPEGAGGGANVDPSANIDDPDHGVASAASTSAPPSASALDAAEEEQMKQELSSEFEAVEDQCSIASQMMDAMEEENLTEIPELLFDIMEFLNEVRPRILKLTQEGSRGELNEVHFAKSLDINDQLCTLLRRFIEVERAFAPPEITRPRVRPTASQPILSEEAGAGGGAAVTSGPTNGTNGTNGATGVPGPEQHHRNSDRASRRPRPPPPPHESGWTKAFTEQGEAYYFNRNTGKTQWEKPAELSAPNSSTPRGHVPVATSRLIDNNSAAESGRGDVLPASQVRVIDAVPSQSVEREQVSEPAASEAEAQSSVQTQPEVNLPPPDFSSGIEADAPPELDDAVDTDAPPAYEEVVSSQPAPRTEDATKEFSMDDL